MRILTYLFIGIVLSVILPFLMAKSSRIYTFGVLMFIGGGLFGSYYYFHEPLKLEDYRLTEIRYQRVSYKETANKIILAAGEIEYGLPIPILKFYGQEDFKEVMKNLSLSSRAKIWLNEGNFIKGIESDSFSMPPEVGLNYDNNSLRGVAKVGWIPATLGLVVIVFNFIANRFQRIVDANLVKSENQNR